MAWSVAGFAQGLFAGVGIMLVIIAPFLGLAIEAGYRLPPSRRARRFATLGGESAAAYVLCFVALTLARNTALHAILFAVTILFLLISLALLAAANRSEERTRILSGQRGVGTRGDQTDDAE